VITVNDRPAPEDMRRALGLFPTGVAVITACHEGSPVGFSCQSLVSLSLDPPLVSFSPSRQSRSWRGIEIHGVFGANIMADDQHGLCRKFSDPNEKERFDGVHWIVEEPGVPLISGCLAFIGARIESVYEAGDHFIVVGRVVRLRTFEGSPLLYFNSGFTILRAGNVNGSNEGLWSEIHD
jgi:3-hydroxy-9,10-secoandrosta-1,3,5(10)-triene-9,17-dione monooxygenase reductase component